MNLAHTKYLHQILYGISPTAAEKTNELSLEPIERIMQFIDIVGEQYDQSDNEPELAWKALALKSLLRVCLDLPSSYQGPLIPSSQPL